MPRHQLLFTLRQGVNAYFNETASSALRSVGRYVVPTIALITLMVHIFACLGTRGESITLAPITAPFEKNPGIKLACFDGEIRENDMLYFSYQIKPGVSTRRLGLEFLNREDVLQLLQSIE